MSAERKISEIDQMTQNERVLDFMYKMAQQRLRSNISELRTIRKLRGEVKNTEK